MDDFKNTPLPGYSPPPKKSYGALYQIVKFFALLLWIAIKLVIVAFIFLIAFIGALAWPRGK